MPTLAERIALRQAQPLPAPKDTLGAFKPVEREPSNLDSFFAAARLGNLTASAVTAARVGVEASRFKPQPDFKPGAYLLDTPDLGWLLESAYEDEDVSFAVAQMRSPEEVQLYAREHLAGMERAKTAFANPIFGTVGLLTGAVVDLPSLLPGVGLVKGVSTIVAGRAAARALASSRLALLGGVEAGLQAELDRSQDLSISHLDALKWFGLGGVLGGTLGAAFPKLGLVEARPRVGVAAPEVTIPPAPKLADEAGGEPEFRSAGAAGAPGVDPLEDLPAKVSSLGHKILNHIPGNEVLRSPIQRTFNWVTDFATNPGVQRHQAAISSLLRIDTATRGEAAGLTVRTQESVEERLMQLKHRYATLLQAQKEGFKALQTDLARDPFMSWRWRRSVTAAAGGEPGVSMPMPGLTKHEFFTLADEWALARGAGAYFTDFARRWFPSAGREATEKLQKHLDAGADRSDQWWLREGKRLLENGTITEDQLVKGVYRPRHFNVDNGKINREVLVSLIRDYYRAKPPQEFIDLQGFVGKALDSLTPTERQDIIDAWIAFNRNALDELAETRLQQAREALGIEKDKAILTALHAKRAELTRLIKQAERQQDNLNRTQTEAGREKWLKALEATEKKIIKARNTLERAQQAVQEVDGLKRELAGLAARAPGRKAREEARQALKAVTKAKNKADRTALAATPEVVSAKAARLEDLVQNTVSNILGEGRFEANPFGVFRAEDATAGTPAHLHPRVLDFTEFERALDPRLQLLTVRNSETLSNLWLRQVGVRDAFQQVFGTTDPTEGLLEHIKDMPLALQAEAKDDISHILNELTGARAAKEHPTMRAFSSAMNSLNVVTMLGNVGLTLVGDVAALHHATRTPALENVLKALLGFTGVTRSVIPALREAGQFELAALFESAPIVIERVSRARGLNELGDPILGQSVGTPGSAAWKFAKLAGGVKDIGVRAMMGAVLMNRWNAVMSEFLNVANTLALTKAMRGSWDEASPGLQEAWRTAGLDPDGLEDMRVLLNKHGTVPLSNGSEVPNIEAWPRAQKEKFNRVILDLGSQGIVQGGPGRGPKAFTNPIGRMIGQFLTFPFVIQSKFLRPAMQHPTSALTQQAILLAVVMGALSDAARQYVNGEGKKWEESWTTPAGVQQRMYNIFTRSVFSTAMVSNFTDWGLIAAGSSLNNLGQLAGVGDIVPEPSKLKQRNIVEALAGPSGATISRSFYTGVTALEALTGDENAQTRLPEQLDRVLPYKNLIWLNLVEQTLSDDRNE